jgi:small subunit ribosomal protein S1
MSPFQVAIDGPAGSGKSSISKQIAKVMHMTHIDTGAMYRAVTLKALQLGIDLNDASHYRFLESTQLDYHHHHMYMDGTNVSSELRTQTIEQHVSLVSSIPYVRQKLVEIQQHIASSREVIMDGRDIGTVVLPNASLKIYLTASVEERAKRRNKEYTQFSTMDELINDIKRRDTFDSTREASPLTKARDAIEIDTTYFTQQEVVDQIIKEINQRMSHMQNIVIPKVGQILEGTVIKVEQNTIYIDLNAMTEGKIHLDNYQRPQPETFIGLVKVGDQVKARIQKITDDPAQILLSRLPILEEEDFEKIVKAMKEEKVVKAKVKKVDEAGLLLTYLNHDMFLPYSLLDFDLQQNKETLKGKTLEVNIIEVTDKSRRKRIVASRKQIFEKARQEAYEARIEAKQKELDSIQTGDIKKGIVDKIETHAATVRFDHVMGLLRISQVSHYRIEHLSDVLKKGQEVEVKVIKKEGSRIDLSMKALLSTPYEVYVKAHRVSETVSGVVVQKLPFGIMVELDQDVRGLLHRSEYSWNPNDNYDAYVKIGQTIELSIIAMDAKKEKIGLSRKTLLDNPWKNVTVKRGDLIQTEITAIDRKGLTVNVQGADGTIAISELAVEKIGRPEDHFQVGDTIEALITNCDPKTWTLELSIRRVKENQARQDFEKFMQEETTQETVTLGDLFEDKLKSKKK